MSAAPITTTTTTNNNAISLTVFGVHVDMMLIVLGIIIAALLVMLYRAQESDSDKFDWHDLVMKDGKASGTQITFMGSWLLSSWAIAKMASAGALSADIFWAYLISFAGAKIGQGYLDNMRSRQQDADAGVNGNMRD